MSVRAPVFAFIACLLVGISTKVSALTPLELLRLTDVAGLALSPDGSQVAFVTRTAALERGTYDGRLYVMSLGAGAKPLVLAPVNPRLGERNRQFLNQVPRWSPDGKSILLISNLDGADQIWAWNISSGEAHRLSSQIQGVLSFDVIPDSTRLGFTTYEPEATPEQIESWRKEAWLEGMTIDLPVYWGDYLEAPGVERHLARRAGVRLVHWIYDPGEHRAHRASSEEIAAFPLGFPGAQDVDYYRFIVTANRTLLARPTLVPPHFTYELAQSHDGARVAVHTKLKAGQRISVLSVGPAAGGEKTEWYRAIDGQFSDLHWSASGKDLYFRKSQLTDDGEVTGIYRISGAGRTPTRIYETGGSIADVTYDARTKVAVFLESSSRQPDRIMQLRLDSGKVSVLYDPNPGLNVHDLPQPKYLSWKNKFGERAFGYLVLPKGKRDARPPLVVVTYRASGFLRGGVGDEYPVYPLVAEGFAVLVLDVGETSSSPSELDSDRARFARFWSQRATVEAAIETVDKLGLVSASQRAITGLSFGAGTAWQAIHHTDLFSVAIVSDGDFDQFGPYMNGIYRYPTASALSIAFVPAFNAERRAVWQEVSAAENALRIRTPILINDSDLEFAYLRQIATTLQGLGKPFDFVVYPGASHVINHPAQRFSIYNRNIDWLKFWMMNQEDSSPKKREQYRRWRTLKAQHAWNEELRAKGIDPGIEFAQQMEAQAQRRKIQNDLLAPALRSVE